MISAVCATTLGMKMPSHPPSDPPLFKLMRDEDTEAVIALWRECGLTRPWNDPAADIALARSKPNAEILVVHEGGAITASIMVGQDGHRAWVYYLAVAPDAQGTGLGRAAMAAAEDWARAQGMPKLQLMVRKSNARVLAFYDALGYEDGHTELRQKWLDPEAERLYLAAQER